jgi:Uma2 family endonuclease
LPVSPKANGEAVGLRRAPDLGYSAGMNALVRPKDLETRRPHLFTVDELQQLITDGLVNKRAVLLDGEIFDVPSDGHRHATTTMKLAAIAMRAFDLDTHFVGIQTTLRLSRQNGPSPDLFILQGQLPEGDVPAERILLVIEVADTSLRDDLTDSASRYARHGVAEYWVVDVVGARIHVHRDPVDGVYPTPTVLEAGQVANARAVPGFSVTAG